MRLDNKIKAVTDLRRKVKNISQASSYLKKRPGVGKFIDNLTKKEVIIENCKEPTLRRFIKSLDKYYYLITSPVDRKYILNKKIEIEEALAHREIVIIPIKVKEEILEETQKEEKVLINVETGKTLKEFETEIENSKKVIPEKTNKKYPSYKNKEAEEKPVEEKKKVEYYTKEELEAIEAEEAANFAKESFDDDIDYDEYDKYYDEK